MMASGERRQAADRVHDAGTGEVHVTVAEAEVRAEGGQPAAAPRPVGEQRVDEGAEQKEETRNAANFQRSAAEPVTMVAAVSMKTIWKRNTTMTPTS